MIVSERNSPSNRDELDLMGTRADFMGETSVRSRGGEGLVDGGQTPSVAGKPPRQAAPVCPGS